MSILDITEEKIFQTLGRGKDPDEHKKAKPKEKIEPFDFTRLLK